MFGTEARIEAMLQDYPSAVMLITLVMALLMTGPMFLIGGINTQVLQEICIIKILTILPVQLFQDFSRRFDKSFSTFQAGQIVSSLAKSIDRNVWSTKSR